MTTGSCKGECDRYRPKDVTGHDKYAQGQKRCTECMMFMDYSGKHCPCCGTVLRTKPRNPRLKRRMEQIMLQKKSEVAN